MNKKDDDSASDYTKDSRKNPVFKNMNRVNRSAVQRDKKNHKVRAEYKNKIQQEVDELDDYEMRFLTNKFGEDDTCE